MKVDDKEVKSVYVVLLGCFALLIGGLLFNPQDNSEKYDSNGNIIEAGTASVGTVSPTGVVLNSTGSYIYLHNATNLEDLMYVAGTRGIRGSNIITINSVDKNGTGYIEYYMVASK